ncbi:MAG: APC family permease [Chromatiaceae bacterium]
MSNDDKIGYWSIVAIGIGGMVGGGIFAVLGLAAQIAHGATPLAFTIAGFVALLTTYSYAKLSVAFPSQGGTITFLDRAFGPGLFAGSLNILLWLSYIIMLSLYAYAFGSYAAVFLPPEWQGAGKHIFISLGIVGITALNLLGAAVIGRAERWIVAFKVSILLVFVAIGLWSVDPQKLLPGEWASPVQIVAGGFIIFLAYEGFELIANAAQDARNPRRTLPRAYYSAVLFVIALYILVAIVTVGNLSIPMIIDAKDYALAAAASPFLGNTGFTLIAIAALLSTASAINATLYGAARVSYIIAREGELPEVLEQRIWNKPVLGLLITTGVTLVAANWLDLNSIATIGSAGFLLIFSAVNIANVILSEQTGSLRGISGLGALACLVALITLLRQIEMQAPLKILVLVTILGMAVGIEGLYRILRRQGAAGA